GRNGRGEENARAVRKRKPKKRPPTRSLPRSGLVQHKGRGPRVRLRGPTPDAEGCTMSRLSLILASVVALTLAAPAAHAQFFRGGFGPPTPPPAPPTIAPAPPIIN